MAAINESLAFIVALGAFPTHLKSTTISLTAIPLSNSKKLYKVESLF